MSSLLFLFLLSPEPAVAPGVEVSVLGQRQVAATVACPAHVRMPIEHPAEAQPVPPSDDRGQILWQYYDSVAIPRNVSMTPDGAYIWVFQELNSQRLQSFGRDSNVPLWEFPLNAYSSPSGVVDSWSGASGTFLAAGMYDGAGHDTLYVFEPESSEPVWTKGFSPAMGARTMQLSGDGTRLIVAAYRSTEPEADLFFSFNPSTGESLWAYAIPESGQVYGMDVSYDGDIILAVTRYNTYVFEGGALRWSMQNPNQSCCGAMSSDGRIICRGDYHGRLYTYSWNGTTYQQKWSYYIVPTAGYYNWVGSADISGDGETIVIGSLEWIAGGYDGRVAMFDSSSGTPLWEHTGCGDFVETVVITPDGRLAIAGSWGDIPNTVDDLLVFERESGTPAFTYGSPGSIFSVDVTDDGGYGAAGAKSVHARQWGQGGYVYAVETGFAPVPLVLTGSIVNGELRLEWTPYAGADAFWVYGAGNQAYFEAGMAPGYQHRLAVLSPLFRWWTTSTGVGDPSVNWSYLVMAVDAAAQTLATSNRVGELDFAASPGQ
jgi:outer membrane protein assembly factor BamB